MTIAALKERRAAKIAEARKISTEAGDAPGKEAKERFDAVEAEIRSLDDQIARETKIADWERTAEAEPVSGSGDFERECRDFSLTRAIASQIPDIAHQVDAGREREISQELARRSDRKVSGLLAPTQVFEKRVLTSTAPAAGPGGNLIPTDHLGGQFIDILRARLIVRGRGARVLSNLSGNVDIPALRQSASAGWFAENTEIGTSDHQFRKVSMSPKHVGARTEFSRNMLLQSSPDIEALVRSDFAAILAEAVDRAAIKGGGANEPTGILATTGVQEVDFSAPSWAGVLEFIEAIQTANAEEAALGWATNPSMVRLLRSTLKEAGDAAAGYIMDAPGQLAGYGLSASTVVPVTEGEGDDESALIFGNWSDLLLGYWSAFEILVNPFAESAYARGNVQVRGIITADVAVRHAQSFAVGTAATASGE